MLKDEDGNPRFDIGLTLAGAISAGAYTAGVVDFLIEALDAWEKAKRDKSVDAPRHSVGLRVVSGASAGSITAAILGGCLKYNFPHVRKKDVDSSFASGNPLYDSWVNKIDIKYLLQTRDLGNGTAPLSLLDSTSLIEIAEEAINYGTNVPASERSYLGNPLRFIFTLTNLRGVPFNVEHAGSNYPHIMTMHGDNFRYVLSGLGRTKYPARRANEYQLTYPTGSAKWGGEWERFAKASLASGAFPVGLSPWELTRQATDYADMSVVVSGGDGRPAEVVKINPYWSNANPKPDGEYCFVNVDGGTINNEPLDLARIELADNDPLSRNERNGLKADRAVIMVAPFMGAEKPGPTKIADVGLLSGIMSTFGALKNQARFNPADVALALKESVYSRFLVAPARSDRVTKMSETSIACGSLGGFGGFFHRKFRQHDFLLGRRNCQQFLLKHFTLPEDNVLFKGVWTADQMNVYGVTTTGSDGSPQRELPVIPLMFEINPTLNKNAEELQADWPVNAFNPDDVEGGVSDRLDGLFNAMAKEDSVGAKLRGAIFWAGWKLYAKPKLKGLVMEHIRAKLTDHGLLRPQ